MMSKAPEIRLLLNVCKNSQFLGAILTETARLYQSTVAWFVYLTDYLLIVHVGLTFSVFCRPK